MGVGVRDVKTLTKSGLPLKKARLICLNAAQVEFNLKLCLGFFVKLFLTVIPLHKECTM